MNIFCLISKRSDFERISKYRKTRNFLKKTWLKKSGMDKYVSNFDFNRSSSKKARFNEKSRFLSHLKKPEVRLTYFESYFISACVICTTSALRWDQMQSHAELVFSLSFTLAFMFFPYFVFACTSLTFHLVKHKENHLKCEQICKLWSCHYFPRKRWSNW